MPGHMTSISVKELTSLRAEVKRLEAIALAEAELLNEADTLLLEALEAINEDGMIANKIDDHFIKVISKHAALATSTPLDNAEADSDEELDNDPASLRRKIELLQQTIESMMSDTDAVKLAKAGKLMVMLLSAGQVNSDRMARCKFMVEDLTDAILARSGEGEK